MILDLFIVFVMLFCVFIMVFCGVWQYLDEKNCNIISKFPQNKELFKIKSYRKAFLKCYKLKQKNEFLLKSSIDNLKDIEMLELELSVYEDKYFKNRNIYYKNRRKKTNSQ